MNYQEFLSREDSEDRVYRLKPGAKTCESILWKEIKSELEFISSERYDTLHPEAKFLISLLISAGKARDVNFLDVAGSTICHLTRLHRQPTLKLIRSMWDKFPLGNNSAQLRTS